MLKPDISPIPTAFQQRLDRAVCWAAGFIALCAAVNAYSYSLTAAIPLIQSDAWYFLDGFLGRFLEYGFSFADLFRQANAQDTNLPLQKLFLFFHTRFFGMDFRLEGLLATGFAVLSVVYFTAIAAAQPLPAWRAREWMLLAAVALVYLSLNSTNIYTWPLAGMWFIPLFMAALYFGSVTRSARAPATYLAATFLIGVLVDEVAYLVFAAAVAASLAAQRFRLSADLKRLVIWGGTGLAISRLLYWWFNRGLVPQAGTAARSLEPLWSQQAWKGAAIPFTESVVGIQNLPEVFGPSGASVGFFVALALGVAHVWFWWRVVSAHAERDRGDLRVTRFAAALMLLFYGLVLGIVVQRVPTFGFEYMHHPRYVLFYQLNLVALLLMVYRQFARRTRMGRAARTVVALAAGLLVAFQLQLSLLAWKHVKYLSVYVAGVSQSFARLQADPASKMECADIMTVCQYPPAKRAELLDRLYRYRMNIFSEDFRAFHRLPLIPPAPTLVATPAPAASSATAPSSASPVPAPPIEKSAVVMSTKPAQPGGAARQAGPDGGTPAAQRRVRPTPVR